MTEIVDVPDFLNESINLALKIRELEDEISKTKKILDDTFDAVDKQHFRTELNHLRTKEEQLRAEMLIKSEEKVAGSNPLILRRNFIQYLAASGIDTSSASFQRKVDKAIHYYAENVKYCSSPYAASLIWTKANMRCGTQTRGTAIVSDIIIDGDVPGAESNKAIFQFVLKDDQIYVLKLPQSNDETQKDFVIKDIIFSKNLQNGHTSFPSGFVQYHSIQILKSDGHEFTGSLSFYYELTLHQLMTPLPMKYIINLANHLISSIKYVHSLGYIIGDIKPENIFLGKNGIKDIGDYGAAVPIGTNIIEFTADFMPAELVEQPAAPIHDWLCLVSTILHMMAAKPNRVTTDSLVKAVKNTDMERPLMDVFGDIFLFSNVDIS